MIGSIGVLVFCSVGLTGFGEEVEPSDPAPIEEPVPEPVPEPEPEPASLPIPGSAHQLLGTLRVTTRSPRAKFDRVLFGSPWNDVDRNGCDTRSDILARDLYAWTEDGCKITAGVLLDPYTGQPILYSHGSSRVDIDHVVALGNGWRSGAAYWTASKREKFANDPLNLLAVSASANRAKGDANAATWLPLQAAFQCRYITLQIAVKSRYRLTITPEEKQTMETVLAQCPEEVAPIEAAIPLRTVTAERNAKSGPRKPRYATCKAAKAAGAAPLYCGVDPEYKNFRDGDGDGLVCE